jgi:hypothetical protein
MPLALGLFLCRNSGNDIAKAGVSDPAKFIRLFRRTVLPSHLFEGVSNIGLRIPDCYALRLGDLALVAFQLVKTLLGILPRDSQVTHCQALLFEKGGRLSRSAKPTPQSGGAVLTKAHARANPGDGRPGFSLLSSNRCI